MAAQIECEREYLRPSAVAQIIGVRVEQVHEWIHAGELPAADLAKRGAKLPRFFVRRADVDEFMSARSVNAARPVKTPPRSKRPAGRRWV